MPATRPPPDQCQEVLRYTTKDGQASIGTGISHRPPTLNTLVQGNPPVILRGPQHAADQESTSRLLGGIHCELIDLPRGYLCIFQCPLFQSLLQLGMPCWVLTAKLLVQALQHTITTSHQAHLNYGDCLMISVLGTLAAGGERRQPAGHPPVRQWPQQPDFHLASRPA